MSRTALYRKYRSKSLDEIVGQEHITDVLAPAIKKGVFSHAYLFTGPRGIGKTSVARIVAYMVNGLKYGEASFDIIEIDAASHGLKEDIKDLIEKARIAPSKDKYKVYIIDEIHSMKHDAFNTFLKILEEPPAHVIFIMATTDPQKLPATILSRAQRFHFRPVEQNKVIAHLKSIAKSEKIEIDDDALKLIAERGEGSMRDSISLLDQLSGFGEKITAKTVEELLGLAPNVQINKIVKALEDKDMAKISEVLQGLKGEGITVGTIVDQLNSELLAKSQYDLIEKLLDVQKSVDPWLKLTAILGIFTGGNVKQKKAPAIETVAQQPDNEIKVEYKNIQKTTHKAKEENSKPKAEEKEILGPLPDELDWPKVIEEAKKINAPFGAWIALSSHDYDEGRLTLYFRTKLQRSKMKEERCLLTLKDALKVVYNALPVIVISDGPRPKSETAAKVADIMGGGELI